jgi:predicted transcriptional regulator
LKLFEEFILGNYRHRHDIIADILEVVSSDAKKTQIMFKANLSYKVLMKYLSEILEASLISFERERQCYTLTNKGHDFLNAYKDYCKINKHVEKQLSYIINSKKVLDELCPDS